MKVDERGIPVLNKAGRMWLKGYMASNAPPMQPMLEHELRRTIDRLATLERQMDEMQAALKRAAAALRNENDY